MTNMSADLARTITRTSSKQSYYTARLMVDPHLEFDCYRAYGYFRWVDDVVDIECKTKADRLAFIQCQKDLVERLYRAENPPGLIPEEEILADLIRNDRDECYRLRSYIRNFLAIIEFDAERKGRLITQRELDWYASTLGKAVTDGIQYFVCNGFPYPETEKRYLAATGAHIVHMLRDLHEDLPEGYINIPIEQIETHHLDLQQPDSPALRAWVKERVELARQYFAEGKQYLDELPVLRCRIVGYWYCARFESLLATIERDGYSLRETYPKSNKLITWLKFAGIALTQTWQHGFFHLRKGSGLCGWKPKGLSNSLGAVPKFE
jgi:phytoene/squalene synthetase